MISPGDRFDKPSLEKPTGTHSRRVHGLRGVSEAREKHKIKLMVREDMRLLKKIDGALSIYNDRLW